MKTFNLFVVILSLTMAVACGDKSKSKGSSNSLGYYNPYQVGTPRSVTGTLRMSDGLLTVSGSSFYPNQVGAMGPGGQLVSGMQYVQQAGTMISQACGQSTYQQCIYRQAAAGTFYVTVTGYVQSQQVGQAQVPGQTGQNILVLSGPVTPNRN
ncbi:MAG: hypothetical protein V4598_13700 [Bdellovibrionota bacterium]